ncbi:MAG: Altered inheritance of mitochondria protein 18 mitochondrial [Claussenomyces sp. TS43310]|nr:MAG: Altered inheritance of mitochondria protein 18 mitochondrial [Claussenomyces sp. TS43310]
MPLLNSSARVIQARSTVLPRFAIPQQCLLRRPQPLPRVSRHLSSSRGLSTPAAPPEPPKNPIDPIELHRLEESRRAHYKRRSYYSGAGFIFGMIAIWVLATSVELPPKPAKLDAPPSDSGIEDPVVKLAKEGKVDVEDDTVATGTSTIPAFPRIVHFSDSAEEIKVGGAEYQLVGLGIRTVSFLGVQVYVVGFYVATDDIATLQEALIRKVNPVATTLVAGEKQQLKAQLLDPEKGEEVWNEVLKENKFRTLLRIVPTRDTDFGHLRDAWVRAITAKSKTIKGFPTDEAFGASLSELKGLFRKGSVPKRRVLFLARDQEGALAVWYYNAKNEPLRLGDIKDERITRALWLNYLSGKKVASEGARQSIADGLMEFVERPVGTVATQVHV